MPPLVRLYDLLALWLQGNHLLGALRVVLLVWVVIEIDVGEV
jgi:hypothetical protein